MWTCFRCKRENTDQGEDRYYCNCCGFDREVSARYDAVKAESDEQERQRLEALSKTLSA